MIVPLTCHDLISRRAFSPLPLVMALTACLTILSADWAEALVAKSAAKMIEIAAQKSVSSLNTRVGSFFPQLLHIVR